MIGFVFKNWKLFIDILIVIGLVLAFTFWDPFDIFQQSKLKRTASLVTGAKDIGQLVTAEYYGEVISSLKEARLNQFPVDQVSADAGLLLRDIRVTLTPINPISVKEKNLPAARALFFANNNHQYIYKHLVAFLGVHYFPNKNREKIFDGEKLSAKWEENILEEMQDEHKRWLKSFRAAYPKKDVAIAFNHYLDSVSIDLSGFYNFYMGIEGKKLEEQKANIVFIGRGWVKAGFDFGKLDKSNLFYEEAAQTIHLYNLAPVVLDHDINPWFIPKQKIKGFELVDFSKGATFKEAIEVKKRCKEKLLAQAGTDLLKKAQENGAEALRNFFSLLLDVPDLKVQFHTTPYAHFLQLVAADSIVSLEDAHLIDSLYQQELKMVDTLHTPELRQYALDQFASFVTQLKQLPFFKKEYPFSYYSLGAAAILRDSFHLHAADTALLLQLRGTLRLPGKDSKQVTTAVTDAHSAWFASGDFLREFNTTMEMLSQEIIQGPYQEVPLDSIKKSGDQFLCKKHVVQLRDTVVVKKSSAVPKDYKKVKAIFVLTEKGFPFSPLDYRYDRGFEQIDLKSYSLSDTIHVDSLVRARSVLPIANQRLRTLSEGEMPVKIQVVKNRLKLAPVDGVRKRILQFSDKLKSKFQSS
jgi:hypothetical protein